MPWDTSNVNQKIFDCPQKIESCAGDFPLIAPKTSKNHQTIRSMSFHPVGDVEIS